MAEFYNWDASAANNNDAPPNGAPENMEYDEVNDTIRELMAQVARFAIAALKGDNVTTGTQPAYVLTSGQTNGGYDAGQLYAFTAHADATGSVTLNVDAAGAAAIVDSRGVQLGSGDIRNGGFYIVRRTATNFRLLGQLSAASLAALVTLTLDQAYQAAGTANAITVTTGKLTAYANGQMVAFRAGAANNTGATTINVDGLGAEALETFHSQALVADDIVAGRAYLAVRVSGEWRIIAGMAPDLANDIVGTLPIANGGTGQTTASAAFGALKQAATDSATGVVELATDAEVRSAASGVSGTVVSASQIESASALVGLTDAATIALNWDSGINFSVTLTANRVLGNPTNGQPGTWRTVYVLGNDATDRTLTFGNQYLGELPAITDIDSGRAYLFTIFCVTASHFVVSSKKALG